MHVLHEPRQLRAASAWDAELGSTAATDEDLQLAARIIGRFSQGKSAQQLDVGITRPGEEETFVTVKPMTSSEIPQDWYI